MLENLILLLVAASGGSAPECACQEPWPHHHVQQAMHRVDVVRTKGQPNDVHCENARTLVTASRNANLLLIVVLALLDRPVFTRSGAFPRIPT
jgi:hypothetical protein